VSDTWAHAPLPYVVVLRVAATEDEEPVTSTHRLRAYSVIEALLQASMQATGHYAEGKVTVESIAPDVEAYWRDVAVSRVTGGTT
jgi:hypothetical protein